MITVMKKLTFLVYHKEYEKFLEDVRELSVLHVVTRQVGVADSPELAAKIEKANHYKTVIEQLELLGVHPENETRDAKAGHEAVAAFDVLDAQIKKTTQLIQALSKDKLSLQPWGDFNPEMPRKLKTAGYRMCYFTSPEKSFKKEWIDEYNATVINKDSGRVYFLTITSVDQEINLDAEVVSLPDTSLRLLETEIQKAQQEKSLLDKRLHEMASKQLDHIKYAESLLRSSITFDSVLLGTEQAADNKVMVLQGWVPKERRDGVIAYLEQNHIFYEESNPTPEDDVPILLKNGWFSKLFEPITEMFALPKYTELDPTPLFAPFFMLFFGLCFGDGGYGILLLLVCLFAKTKVKPALKNFCNLGIVLSITTIVVALFTGCFFGVSLVTLDWPWLAAFKPYFLTEANWSDKLGGYDPLMVLAVVLGIVQILWGMCCSAAKTALQFGFKYALSTIGWIVLIAGSIATFGLPALGVTLPMALLYALYGLLGLAVLVIYFYNSPGKNIFLNFGSGIWNTYNMATGLLGDTLSYIRLFALGLTGGILGGVFNTLAFQLTADLPFVAKFFGVLFILLFGHSINIGLCLIGSFVHPMRLTFVEFYKNAGFEGGGIPYDPFEKIKETTVE